MQFDTKVSGIPCICKVIHHSPYKPMRITGSGMGDCDPPEYEQFEFTILDRRGYPANWLEKKLKPEDTTRLLEEYNLETTGERYGYLC